MPLNPPTTELVFIRHGETDWNRQQRFQGQIDVPLNALGHAQAARLGARLAAHKPDAFFSSDLLRTRETSAPLAAAWQMQPQLAQGLREQHFGIFEGLDVPTIKAQHAALWQAWLEHDASFALPQGESLQQFHRRVIDTVRELAQGQAGRKLTLVTHGGVLDMLWRTAHGLPLSGLRDCEIPNTGINVLRWRGGSKDGTLEVASWADAEHLVGLPKQPNTAAGER
jgi:2,3-bisphosphoglycerate-dependent phosphoglycerate mutase